jgi:septum site-determining protein MinC
VTLLRGRRNGLEVALAGRDLEAALAELEARLAERPEFYRGSAALATFGRSRPSPDYLTRLRAVLNQAGIELRGVSGLPELEQTAREAGLDFHPAAAPPRLSEKARSLVADFAGARADIAARRKRGEASVPRLEVPQPPAARTPLHAVETPPATLYHTGTLRGGQALHHLGNIVLVGDVNPGAELVATGDVAVFGRLAGVVHAGAQGDETARVYAIVLAPTQLRIATYIAADAGAPGRAARPEVAFVRDKQIAVAPLEQLDRALMGEVS